MFYRLKDKFFVLSIIALIFLSLIVMRLVKLQIIDSEDFKRRSQEHLSNNQTITAPRGKILDRYGRSIVTNKLGFSVSFNNPDMSDDEMNDLILNTVELFKENQNDYADSFPIGIKDGEYVFEYEDLDGDELETKVRNCKFTLKISDNLDAKQCIDALRKKFGLDNRYTKQQTRDIIAVRYEMTAKNFSESSPFTFSLDASIQTVSAIKENNDLYKGLSVESSAVRDYVHGSMAAHILGRVGLIYKEEYNDLKNKGYSMNSVIGKDGMEKVLEQYIRGKDGKKSISRSVDSGNDVESQPAVPGDNAMLTIDVDLQKVAEKSLAERIESIKDTSWTKADNAGKDVGGGSVVVEDVETGEILAMASYPTYDPDSFNRDYSKLSTDKSKPLFNRAISGTYPPGSVFKMLTTIAGLEEDKITPETIIVDEGVYEYYGQKFNCWIYTETGATHGPMDASNALKNSCNYFYYEVGKRLGIDTLVEYGKKMHLGQKTGIEIDGEVSGVLASEEYKKKTLNEIWYPGDTLQMAIGQSYNLFTPIQLANYISTIANGGSIYKPHLTKCVRDHETGDIVTEKKPEVTGKVNMSKSTYDAVTYGMRLVSYDGTASGVFGDFPIETCSKTGSSQVEGSSANGVFVSYAPYDNPKIAIAIVIESAGSGSVTAPIAKDIYTEYFKLNPKQSDDVQIKTNLLIP